MGERDEVKGLKDSGLGQVVWVTADGTHCPLSERLPDEVIQDGHCVGGTVFGFGLRPPEPEDVLAELIDDAADSLEEALELVPEGPKREALRTLAAALDRWLDDPTDESGRTTDDQDDER